MPSLENSRGLTAWAGGGRGVICTSIDTRNLSLESGTLYGCPTKNRTESFLGKIQ